jgi:hypothetical protein
VDRLVVIMADWEKYLESIYFDVKHPGSFSGPEKLYKVAKSEGKFAITMRKIRRFLQDKESYSLTRGARRKFPRSRVIVEVFDIFWDVDLMDMVDVPDKNDGYKYVLLAIDVFSRFVRCQALKNKTGGEVVKALKRVFADKRVPKVMRTDKGGEFNNKEVSKYLDTANVHRFSTQNETKANYAERAIKTIKHKIFRYALKKRSYRYVDVLADIVNSYNDTIHQSLGRTPRSIDKTSEGESRLEQYLLRTKKGNKRRRPKKYKYDIGQTVRVSHVRNVFDREYSQKWTGELFKIVERFERDGIPVYKIKDWAGDEVIGTFYESELQDVNVDDDTEYHIDKVLKKRGRGGRREVLVRWLHWPEKYDSWIPERDVTGYE